MDLKFWKLKIHICVVNLFIFPWQHAINSVVMLYDYENRKQKLHFYVMLDKVLYKETRKK